MQLLEISMTSRLFTIFLLTLGSASGADRGAPSWTIAVPSEAGPYSQVENGQSAGFDLDYVQAAAQIAALAKVDFLPVESAADGLARLGAGDVQAVLGVSFDQAGAIPDSAVLSEPYRTERLQGYVRRDTLFRNSGDLPHASIAVPADSTAHRYATARGWEVIETSSWTAAFAVVANGGADATLCDGALAAQQLLDGGFENLRTLSGMVHQSPVSVAMAPAAMKLQDGLEAVRRTGHAIHLQMRWEVSPPPVSDAKPSVDYRVLLYGGLVLIAALLVLSRGNHSLRRRNPAGVTTTPVISDPAPSK